MPRLSPELAPSVLQSIADLGARLKALRLAKGISTVRAAQDLRITRVTLARLERGDPGTSLAVYASALHYLGLESDLKHLASTSVAASASVKRSTSLEAAPVSPAVEEPAVSLDSSSSLPTVLL